MATTVAFATPVPICASWAFLSNVHVNLDIGRGSRRSDFSLARRRRVTLPITAHAEAGFSEVGDGGADTSASDLALPDLRALFDSAGDPDCEVCEGAGVVPCMVCDGTGVFTMTMMDTVSTTVCRMCKGKKTMPCPACRKEVYKSVLWWDLIPSKEEDPDENWREGPDGEPRLRWNDNPADPNA